MPLFLNLNPGDGISVNGPARITLEKREGKGARLKIDADKAVKIDQHRAPGSAAAIAAQGLKRQPSHSGMKSHG